MIDLIYIEREVASHPRTRAILERFPRAARIECERYGEIFNRRAQNFRVQKQRPALILARKFDHFALPAPEGYGIGGRRNFYFSHMLNCVYDCRYCFLQGMFQSAHYALFVNYEDFFAAMDRRLDESPGEDVYFFSGYDCDSLALESVTHFAADFLPYVESRDRAWLELRTKSAQVRALLERPPVQRCVVAFSLMPPRPSRLLERGVPPLESRLDAMAQLQERGWPIGLRFDPLLYYEGFREDYRELFDRVFRAVRPDAVHSVSLGPFRLPREIFKTMVRLYPEEKLFAGPLGESDGMISYRETLEEELIGFCTEELERRIPQGVFFPCGVK